MALDRRGLPLRRRDDAQAAGNLQFDVGPHWSGRNRPLPHHGDASDVAFRPGGAAAEDLADADEATVGRDHHRQRSHAEPDRDALHQGIADPREAAGEEEVMSAFGTSRTREMSD